MAGLEHPAPSQSSPQQIRLKSLAVQKTLEHYQKALNGKAFG
jgi:hypothetical protein